VPLPTFVNTETFYRGPMPPFPTHTHDITLPPPPFACRMPRRALSMWTRASPSRYGCAFPCIAFFAADSLYTHYPTYTTYYRTVYIHILVCTAVLRLHTLPFFYRARAIFTPCAPHTHLPSPHAPLHTPPPPAYAPLPCTPPLPLRAPRRGRSATCRSWLTLGPTHTASLNGGYRGCLVGAQH